jgi:hypothetical protein
MNKIFASIGLSLVLLMVSSPSLAQEQTPNVTEIIKKANHAAYYQGDNGRARVDMIITDKQGRVNRRRFTILRKDIGDANIDADQKFYIYFHKPADVKKTTFLVWKNLGKADDRWLYLPALDLVKRIAASDDRTSFVGSHFYYEDVSGRGLSADTHQLTRATDQHYVIKSTPKDPKSVEFSYYISYVDKVTYLPFKTEYYDAKNKIYRRFEALKTEKIDGFDMVTQAVIYDLNSGGKTQMKYRKIEFNMGLNDSIFTERSLRKAPKKYLK